MSDVRRRAAELVDRLLDTRRPADELIAAAASDLDDRDARLLAELVRGTLRWLRRLDHVIASASGRPLGKIDSRLHAPLRIGVYQLLYLDRVPAHAAVDQAVGEAKRRAGRRPAGLVNAVLRKIAARPTLEAWPVEGRELERLAIETSHPEFLVGRWLERFGAGATRAFLAANNRPKPMTLLCLRPRDRIAASVAAAGVSTEPCELSPVGLRVTAGNPIGAEAFRRGEIYVQDETSQAAAWVPPPRAGELVLDAAAAPGGKSFALRAREPGVRSIAMDVSSARLTTLRANMRRLEIDFPVLAGDASAPPFGPVFDRVVADLPCSGTGTLARHPELKWRLSPQEIDRLASQGLEIVAALARCVRPGGLLSIVTCSLEQEENDDVVARVLARRPELALVDLEPLLEGAARSGVAGRGKWQVLTAPERDGFTVHVLRRAASSI